MSRHVNKIKLVSTPEIELLTRQTVFWQIKPRSIILAMNIKNNLLLYLCPNLEQSWNDNWVNLIVIFSSRYMTEQKNIVSFWWAGNFDSQTIRIQWKLKRTIPAKVVYWFILYLLPLKQWQTWTFLVHLKWTNQYMKPSTLAHCYDEIFSDAFSLRPKSEIHYLLSQI